MRLIFMGTPDFAAEGLKALLGAGHEISLVLTQPDRPRGRHSAPRKSEVRLLAEEHGISVLTPSRLFTDEEAIGRIRELSPELIVVSAFGQLLPKEVLEIPDYGCVNIHASLLPRFRGASPVQWAILSGDKESGVTTMQMDEGLDTGDILLQESVPLAKGETGGSLFEKLSKLGGKLILETIDGLERGTIQRRRQPEEGALRVGLLKKSSGLLNWNEPSDRLERRIRALNPWPGSFSYLLGKQLKLWKADSLPGGSDAGELSRIGRLDEERILSEAEGAKLPREDFLFRGDAGGLYLEKGRNDILIRCGEGFLRILELQEEGRRRMDAASFLRGRRIFSV